MGLWFTLQENENEWSYFKAAVVDLFPIFSKGKSSLFVCSTLLSCKFHTIATYCQALKLPFLTQINALGESFNSHLLLFFFLLTLAGTAMLLGLIRSKEECRDFGLNIFWSLKRSWSDLKRLCSDLGLRRCWSLTSRLCPACPQCPQR